VRQSFATATAPEAKKFLRLGVDGYEQVRQDLCGDKTMAEQTDVPKPTTAEVALLRVLWDLGPSTVGAVVDEVHKRRPGRQKAMGYTTALKFFQIMTDKGLVRRDDSHRAHVYRPAPGAEEHPMQRRLITDLIERAFGGSMRDFMMQALASSKASTKEMTEIRKLLSASKKKA